jgi:hypothetical protein
LIGHPIERLLHEGRKSWEQHKPFYSHDSFITC